MLEASLVLGSFGSTQASVIPILDIAVHTDPSATLPAYEPPVRYGKQPEIHHTFNSEPKNPPRIVSVVFALGVLATVPALFIGVRIFCLLTGGSPMSTSKTVVIANISLVGSARSQLVSRAEGFGCRAHFAPDLLWFNRRHGGRLLPLLHGLALILCTAGHWGCWCHCLPEWNQGARRSPEPTLGRGEVKPFRDDEK